MTSRYGRGVLVALLLTSACRGAGSSPPKSAPAQTINDGGTVDAAGRSSVEVTATNFLFSPSTIDATPGQVLKLVVHNTSGTPHNLSQSAQGVDEDLDPGATKTVTLTVPASGRLVFVCSFHSSSGMAGSLGPAGSTAPPSSPAPATSDDRSDGY